MRKSKRINLNDRGYTLVEAIFQLALFALFAQLCVLIIIYTVNIISSEKKLELLNWELFVSELNYYLQQTTSFAYKENSFVMTDIIPTVADKSYYISASENHIRLTTDKNGNIIMLPNANKILIVQGIHDMRIKIHMKTGNIKERTFVVPLRE